MNQESGNKKMKSLAGILLGIPLCYFLISYVAVPMLWKHHEDDKVVETSLDSLPKVTENSDGIPGDALNVGLIGSREQLIRAMIAVGWRPADPITFDSSIKIAESVLLDEPDPDAPVSNLYVFGRKQDFAFEREVGSSADKRHHVRWWRVSKLDTQKWDQGERPFWIGDASFDIGSGVSHLTGQITHHIDADIDAQRDQLFDDLNAKQQLQKQFEVPGVGATQDGRNAGGDRYFTDGKMYIGVLKALTSSATAE